MRMHSKAEVVMTLDFEAGLITFALSHTDRRGKLKETVAEVPGLFTECTVAACFGGREQQLTIGSWEQLEGGGDDVARRGDAFAEADALGGERVAPLSLNAASEKTTAELEREVAETLM